MAIPHSAMNDKPFRSAIMGSGDPSLALRMTMPLMITGGRSGDSKVNCLLKQYVTRIATSAPQNHLIDMSFLAPER